MKAYIEILFLIVAVIILTYLSFHYAGVLLSPVTQQSSSNRVCFEENCFQVELARTQAEKEKGLMFRKQLDKGRGMLFIFDREGIYPFWMKNTLIPLDIIWIDAAGKVVFISQNVQPCKSVICPTIIPPAKAKYILEVNAGICKELGLKLGDGLNISLVDAGT